MRLISSVDTNQFITKKNKEIVISPEYGVQATTLLKVRPRNVIGDLSRLGLTA